VSPLKGVIISTDNVLVIRLASRAQVRVAHQKNLRLGDTAYVLFDYTRLKVREIWTEEEHDRRDDTGSKAGLVLVFLYDCFSGRAWPVLGLFYWFFEGLRVGVVSTLT
jgi:hypothetical protein